MALYIIQSLIGMAQYLVNPSFEGIPQADIPPPNWYICSPGSTPDVQPGIWEVYLPASNGDTYIGLTSRENFTWEDVHATLTTPLSTDSCYIFQIDLAFEDFVYSYYREPLVLMVYGYNTPCDKNYLLWQSPVISDEYWLTYEFMVHPNEVDITDLVLEAYYTELPAYWGYIMIDNIRIQTTPFAILGNDTTLTLCEGDTFMLDPGSGFDGYLWQDGSTQQTYLVDTTGFYWVEVLNEEGCSWTDSIYVTVEEYLQLDIGNDTILCIGDSLLLHAGGGFMSYLWQDNSIDPTYIVSTSGLYWVTVSDSSGCFGTDSIEINFLPPPEICLGEDFTFCSGEEQLITPGQGYLSYLWQDNTTNDFYTVFETGLYWVTVFNGCGTDSDTVYAEALPSPEPDLGPDTILCEGQTLYLDLGNQYLNYTWQDNSSLPFFMVTDAGYYFVIVENNYGCFGDDEIIVDISYPDIDLGGNGYVCEGDTVILDAGDEFESYLWQDNSTNQTYIVSEGGTYTVTFTDVYGCMGIVEVTYELYPYPTADLGTDQQICEGTILLLEGPDNGDYTYYWNGIEGEQVFEVSESGVYQMGLVNACDSVSDEVQVLVMPVPSVYLGEDKILFPGQTIELDAGNEFDSYIWQDGSGEQYYVVTENNIYADDPYYYVEVTEGICKNSDTVKIELFEVWVPQVITPNGDGKNDLFQPDPNKWHGIRRHTIMVFNRWGEKIWESEDFESGWDGKQNGRNVTDGTYFWILEVYYGQENIKQILKGSLTVLGSVY